MSNVFSFDYAYIGGFGYLYGYIFAIYRKDIEDVFVGEDAIRHENSKIICWMLWLSVGIEDTVFESFFEDFVEHG